MSEFLAGERALLLVRNGVEHDARVLRAAKVLVERGATVLVVGVSTGSVPAGRTVIEGVCVVRVPGSLRASGVASDGPAPGDPRPAASQPTGTGTASDASWTARAAARRTVRATAYARRAIAVARAWRPTLVHANDHNTMWPALAIRRLTDARILYDSHELWADRNGRPEWRPGLLAAEALFVRVADAVVTASPGYSAALAERHRIPLPSTVRNIPVGGAVFAPDPPAGDAVVVYVGGLMRGRGLEPAIDALALVPGVRLRVIGPGPAAYVAALRARATAAGVADRVELVGAVPPGEVVEAAAGASLGLAMIEPICRSYELTLPNKLFEYARAGVPVLSSPVPVLAGVVRDHGIGVVSRSHAAADVADAIRTAVDANVQRGLRDAVARYAEVNSWEGEAPILSAAYGRALGCRP